MADKKTITVGMFYELPNGKIARLYGWSGKTGTGSYYFDDDNGSLQVTEDEFQSWTPRQDLADFPNARDPRVPYVFDLHWDIKHLSQVKKVIASGMCCPYYDEPIHNPELFMECVKQHNINIGD